MTGAVEMVHINARLKLWICLKRISVFSAFLFVIQEKILNS